MSELQRLDNDYHPREIHAGYNEKKRESAGYNPKGYDPQEVEDGHHYRNAEFNSRDWDKNHAYHSRDMDLPGYPRDRSGNPQEDDSPGYLNNMYGYYVDAQGYQKDVDLPGYQSQRDIETSGYSRDTLSNPPNYAKDTYSKGYQMDASPSMYPGDNDLSTYTRDISTPRYPRDTHSPGDSRYQDRYRKGRDDLSNRSHPRGVANYANELEEGNTHEPEADYGERGDFDKRGIRKDYDLDMTRESAIGQSSLKDPEDSHQWGNESDLHKWQHSAALLGSSARNHDDRVGDCYNPEYSSTRQAPWNTAIRSEERDAYYSEDGRQDLHGDNRSAHDPPEDYDWSNEHPYQQGVKEPYGQDGAHQREAGSRDQWEMGGFEGHVEGEGHSVQQSTPGERTGGVDGGDVLAAASVAIIASKTGKKVRVCLYRLTSTRVL